MLARSADDSAIPHARDDAGPGAGDAGVDRRARLPMGKSQGEYFGRLTSAVARLALASSDPNRLFVDGFEN